MPWKLRKKPPHNVKTFYFQNFSVFAMTLTSVLKVGNVAGSFFEQTSDTFGNTPHLYAIPLTTLTPPTAKTSVRCCRIGQRHKTFGTVALHSKVTIIKQKTFEMRNICCKFHFTTPTKTYKEKI